MRFSGPGTYLNVARATYPVAVALLVGVFLTEDGDPVLAGILLTAGGLLLFLRGLLMLTMREAVLEPMAAREARGPLARLGIHYQTPYGAALSIAIGLGWAFIGVEMAFA